MTPPPAAQPKASGPPRLIRALALPNPGARGFMVNYTGNADEAEVEVFSSGYVKVLSLNWRPVLSAADAAWASLDASAPLKALASGTYFARLSLISPQGRDSALIKLVILR
jgi:hypothetical protein